MRVRTIRPADLDAGLRARWKAIQRSDADLASPYFSVEFTQAVGSVRDDVYVGVIEQGSEVVGFFPYHRRRLGAARPVGLGLSDCHGVVIRPEIEWSAAELLKQSGLDSWEFDHLIASQAPFRAHHSAVEASPIIEVADGLAAYERRRTKMGGSELKSVRRKTRKLAREHEAHRFVEHERSEARLDQLFRLKSAQCRESGAFDYFSLPWTTQLVRRLLEFDEPDFGGVFSSLYVGEECVAVHFGMRTDAVWHWWFPNYESSFGRYSPGLILLLEIVRVAAEKQYRHIDLGKDLSRYKSNLMTSSIDVAEGRLARPSLGSEFANACRWIERSARVPILRPILRVPAAVIRRASRRLRYD